MLEKYFIINFSHESPDDSFCRLKDVSEKPAGLTNSQSTEDSQALPGPSLPVRSSSDNTLQQTNTNIKTNTNTNVSNPLQLATKYADEDDDDLKAVINEDQEQSQSLLGADNWGQHELKTKRFLNTDV
jgi:hypothetical protein